MYRVFTKLNDGEFLFVASRGEFEQAARLIKGLGAHWPNEVRADNAYTCHDARKNALSS
jgi:hypothetical protein